MYCVFSSESFLSLWYLCVTYLPALLKYAGYMARLAWSDLTSYVKKIAEFLKTLKSIDVAAGPTFACFFC